MVLVGNRAALHDSASLNSLLSVVTMVSDQEDRFVVAAPPGRGPGSQWIHVTLWKPKSVVDWLDYLLFGRGRYPRERRAQIRADAEDLLNRMSGGEAYAVAGRMCYADPPIIDRSRPERHWHHVRRAIAEHLGIRVGGSGYD